MRRPSRLGVLVVALAAVLVACEAEDIALARSFIQEWIVSHPVEIGKAELGIGSGDVLADAGVMGYEAVKDIKKADELMDEGRTKQSAEKMDEAIKIRPRDWTYQLSRSNLALQKGDVTTYNKYFSLAVNEVGVVSRIEPNDQDRHFYEQNTYELEAVDQRLNKGMPAGSVLGFRSREQCHELYDRLYVLATRGYSNLSGSKGASAQYYLVRRQDCGTLPQ